MRHPIFIRVLVVGALVLAAVPIGGRSQRNRDLARPTPPKVVKVAAKPPAPYQIGRASWYGEKFHGRITAQGEQYDMFQLTAAHARIPLGSLVRVTHMRNRRSVVVRINDRCPSPNTAIDLSWEAARALNMVKQGRAWVKLDILPKRAAETLADD